VIRIGAPVTETYDERRFGVAYVVAGVPVKEVDGEVRGVFMCVRFVQSTDPFASFWRQVLKKESTPWSWPS